MSAILFNHRIQLVSINRMIIRLDEIINDVEQALDFIIRENNVIITTHNLPEIPVMKPLITQLFQNLILNAIKYQKEDPPEIVIEGKMCHSEYVISVKDNGRGIEQKYLERVFMIFQRTPDSIDISGSGIGLANCKKNRRTPWGKNLGGIGTRVWFNFYFYYKKVNRSSNVT